jgi:hypothetical protein
MHRLYSLENTLADSVGLTVRRREDFKFINQTPKQILLSIVVRDWTILFIILVQYSTVQWLDLYK